MKAMLEIVKLEVADIITASNGFVNGGESEGDGTGNTGGFARTVSIFD